MEPNSSRLTYYSYVRNSTDVNPNNVFSYLDLTEKKFPNSSVGAKRSRAIYTRENKPRLK